MARIRTVKPEFWKHEELSALPEFVHMLACSLLNYADDEGYFNANEKLVKAECLPLRDSSVTIHGALNSLSNAGYLRLGNTPDGKRYGHIKNFTEHQVVNRPKPSKIKLLSIVWDESVSIHTQITEQSSQEGNGKEGKERKKDGADAPTAEKQLFDRGVDILGEKGRGLVARLLAAKGKNIALARSALETASTKSNPAEYLGAVIRGPKPGELESDRQPGVRG